MMRFERPTSLQSNVAYMMAAMLSGQEKVKRKAKAILAIVLAYCTSLEPKTDLANTQLFETPSADCKVRWFDERSGKLSS